MSKLSSTVTIIAVAAFLTLTANTRFFSEVVNIYPLADHTGFITSVGVVLMAAITFTLSLFSLLLPVRLLLGLFLVVAAMCGYFTDQFGVVISAEMLENVLQTDVAEAHDLLTGSFILRVLLLGILATLLVWKLPLKDSRWHREIVRRSALAVASLGIALATIFIYSDYYANFFREHRELRAYTNPLMPVYGAIKFAGSMFHSPENHTLIRTGEDAHIAEADEGRELIILVVGETARSDRFSLNGYSRETNPELAGEQRIVSYEHIASCGTSTAISVPCMFSASGHSEFSVKDALHHENVLDILQRAGVSVLWRDNNSSSKGVADRVRYEDFRTPQTNPVCDTECRDIGMLAGLQQYIDEQSGDILIVLHQMGNHGPAYFRRYPASFEHFKPACHSLELSDCSPEEIDNAYDNAIRYTDYFLSQVIQLLKDNTPAFETAMLYVSDHGESLGEHGLFLHGAPYMFAPGEQTSVPVILWLGESADIDLREALEQKQKENSHDAVFHSLLSAFEVETSELDKGSSLFAVNQH